MKASNPDFQVERSRATEPLFYRAPYPETLPNGMSIMEFQLAGVEYVLARDHALIGDAPGLTKTAQSIMVSNAIRAKRTLCIVPASLRLNWEREIWHWSTLDNVSTYPVLSAKDGISDTANYVIISYNLLNNPSILNALMALSWDHMILDEAHAIKDPKGNKRTQVICAPDLLPSVVGRITLLSGTILPNQPIECYNACRLLNHECIDGMSLHSFRENYYEMGQGYVTINGKPQWSDQVRNVPTNLADLQYRLRKHIMVRRIPEQVYPEMPAIRWHPFPLQITGKIRKAMKHDGWKAASKLYDLDNHAFDGGIPIDGEISTARRELGEAKMAGVSDYIHDLIDGGVAKLIVAAWHHSVLDYLREALEHYGLVYMDGRTSTKNKQKAVDQFQSEVGIKIILGQTIPLGMGWTLTEAHDVVNAEPDWVPGNLEQLMFRIRRPGQTATHLIGHLPIVPDTLDERIISRVIEKETHIHKALDLTY